MPECLNSTLEILKLRRCYFLQMNGWESTIKLMNWKRFGCVVNDVDLIFRKKSNPWTKWAIFIWEVLMFARLARSVSWYPYNRSKKQYVKYTKWSNIAKEKAKLYVIMSFWTKNKNTTTPKETDIKILASAGKS